MSVFCDYARNGYDVVMRFESEIYPLESVLIACDNLQDIGYFYVFSDDGEGGRGTGVGMKVKDGSDAEGFAGEFDNEVMRQALRLGVAKLNREIRKNVVGRAMESAMPVEDDGMGVV